MSGEIQETCSAERAGDRERERQRDRQRGREAERHTERHTERQRDRETYSAEEALCECIRVSIANHYFALPVARALIRERERERERRPPQPVWGT
jgi:hypothetical protein